MVKRVNQNNFGWQNKISNMDEHILAQTGLVLVFMGLILFMPCLGTFCKLNFPGVGKFLNLQNLKATPLNPVSNISLNINQRREIWPIMKT